MKNALFVPGVFFLFLLVPAADASGQIWQSGQPGEDRFTVGVFGGLFDPVTTYRDGSSFDSDQMIGGSLTFWANRTFGFTLTAGTVTTEPLATPEGGTSIIAGTDPRSTFVLADARARYPIATGQAMSLAPYLALGVGTRFYEFDRPDVFDGTRFAGTFAGGTELRFGQEGHFGLRGEARNVLTRLNIVGEEGRQSDWLYSIGLIVNF